MRKILIAEDVRSNRAILKNMLQGEYTVLEAEDGVQALEILRREAADISLLLLDLEMPRMNGYEVLDRMHRDAALSAIPVIVATGTTDSSAEVRALSMGAQDFIAKPYSGAVIRQRIANTIKLRETAATANALQRDRLTGLYNREFFFKRVDELVKTREPGYYVMTCFDVDHFKVVNDQYGTDKGDEVLRHIANTFQASLEPDGGICCRISADNFALLYPRHLMDSDASVDTLRRAANPGGELMPLTFSIGRYIVDDLTLSASAMYDRASLAEESAKGNFNANIALYNESMRQRLLQEQKIVTEMNAALEGGQFEIWLQPQYNHATGNLIGAEALVRWRHSSDGRFVPPGAFVPVFEKNGFIYEMDKFVWEQACALLRKWLDAGRDPMPISVNVSRYDVLREDFFGVITGLLERYALPTEMLRLEITETAFSKGAEQMIRVVKRLIEYGFTVEIDDFGSGYSSLNTLKDVPAQVVKLDMKFLENTDDSQRGGNILESIIRMAKWLGMAVVAEGVETQEQADFLKSVGCNYVQGYLYAMPMTVADYEALAKEHGKEREMLTLQTVDNLDNNAFWDPRSMDTLIFNSYVGGACICEFHNGAVELLRINDHYIREMGIQYTPDDPIPVFDLTLHTDAEGKRLLIQTAQSAIETGKEQSCEIRLAAKEGRFDRTRDLQVTIRCIARASDRYLLYSIIHDITERRLLEQAESESAEQLRFLGDMSRDLLAQSNTGEGIDGALKKLMRYFDGNRAYIFEFNFERNCASNTYEICGEGVSREKDNLQNIPFDQFSYWFHAFDRERFISIADVDALPDDRTEKPLLQAQGIRSIVAVPLRRNGQVIGILGVDDPRRMQTQVERLLALGDYISVMLARRDDEMRLCENAETLSQLIQDMPGGFVKMRITDAGVVPVFMNKEFCRICGMTHDEAVAMYGRDAYAGVHPDDAAYTNAVISEAIRNRTTVSLRIRFSNGRGDYVPMQTFYRVTEDAAGNLHLNGYYTDATEINRLEEQRRELLENLPCGAGIYEITANGMRATYLNKQYRTYLKREIGTLSEAPVFEVVHPEDVKKLQASLKQAMAGDGEGVCDIRIMDGAGGYIPFHVTGRIMGQSEGKTSIYVTYMPITENEMLLQKRAETDGMTGVYNKLTAEELIKRRLSERDGVPCAMLIADVDNLKTINDSLGHPQGDRTICTIADTLKSQFRKTDVVGRIGGDEFVVFLLGVDSPDTLKSMMRQLYSRLEGVLMGDKNDTAIHISVGIAMGETGKVSFDELYSHADKALYDAKEGGKNRYSLFAD